MNLFTREEKFRELFPEVPSFRLRQMTEALFEPARNDFTEVTVFPEAMRATLAQELPWLALTPVAVFESAKKDTVKAVVALHDGKRVETVLMENARGHYTVCVSSQVGCAMACSFCATGKMGFTRNLSTDEIVDQYRFWNTYLHEKNNPKTITNIVFMGMGEPLANYEAVKVTLNTILEYTDIGPTRITVSTVGLLPMLEKILNDPEWPAVRLAVSLHSADSKTRQAIMPSSFDGFLEKLSVWTAKYFEKFDSKRRHLTFEYVMLSGVNDTAEHAQALVAFTRKIGKVRVNLIPYNYTGDTYRGTLPGDFSQFEGALRNAGVDVTRRRTMGEDIAAACGQLIVEKERTF